MATLSRRARDTIEAAFAASVDGGAYSPLLPSRLHDFGFRGCTSVEQSVLGGCAHLLSFEGTDTLSAAYYAQVGGWGGRLAGFLAVLQGLLPLCATPALASAPDATASSLLTRCVQFHLNGGRPVAMSIPATEHRCVRVLHVLSLCVCVCTRLKPAPTRSHSLCLLHRTSRHTDSVMTCWPTEAGAILNMIDNFGTGIFATVMDSYDYTAALNEVVPGGWCGVVCDG